MRRVAVIGCGGAGKTTLSLELGRRLGLPALHVDGHYWRGSDARTSTASSTRYHRSGVDVRSKSS